MSVQVEKHGAELVARVEGEFTIYRIAELKAQLSALLEQEIYLEIDLAAVEELDSAGVQLMLALQRESRRLGKMLSFSHAGAPVAQVLDLYNLGELLQPAAAPGRGE